MKVKVRKDKLTGEMHIEYYMAADKSLFRYTFMNNIFENESDITVLIDTNNRKSDIPILNCEDFLKQSGVTYSILPTEANKTRLFGLPIDFSRKKKEEKLIIIHIAREQFTPEFFRCCLENYDIGIGFGGKEAFDEYLSHHILNMSDVLFNDSVFEKSIYDSIFCMSIRSSFDIERYAKIQ